MHADADGPVRILVVEDESTLRNTCVSVLRNQGYEVASAARGDEALERVREPDHDILLVDLYMAEVPGTELVEAALDRRPDRLVIVMTGNPTLETTLDVLDRGAWDYLPKPFSAKQIEILVGRAAHVARRRRATGVGGAVEVAGPLTRAPYAEARARALEDFDRQYLTSVLDRAAGDIDEAARLSGLEADELEERLRAYGLEPLVRRGA